MPLWSDNFDRADGPLGANWTVESGSAYIASNKMGSTGGGFALAGPVTGPGSMTAQAVTTFGSGYSASAVVLIKCSTSGAYYYGARAYRSGADIKLDILLNNNGSLSSLGTATIAANAATTGTLRITYSGTTLTLYFNGVQYLQATNSVCAAQSRAGILFYGSGYTADDFAASGDGAPQLFVTPKVVGTDDGDQVLSILGTAVTWTVGTPGAPTFAVDQGAFNNQSVTSTTTATVLFSPPATPQVVTITDTPDGLSVTLTVVEGTYLGGGTGGAGNLPEDVVSWLTLQASHAGLIITDQDTTTGDVNGILLKSAWGELLLGSRTAAGTPTPPTFPTAALAALYARLWGGEEFESASFAESGTNAVKTDLLALLAVLSLAKTGGSYEVGSLARELSGFPGGSHQDILDAISGIVVDNSEVLDAIEAAQGDPLATIKAVLDSIFTLGGSENNYNLATVKTWVEAVQGSGLPTIKGVLDKLGTSSMTEDENHELTRQTIITQVTMQAMLDALITAVTGGAGVTIASATDDILDAINGLPTATALGAPVWPGLAGVTLGESLALSDGLEIPGPMHGVLVTISATPPGASGYPFGDATSWSHVGGIIFQNDDGFYERSESIGLESMILTPKTMVSAASAVLRLNAGWQGTIRPWTVTA